MQNPNPYKPPAEELGRKNNEPAPKRSPPSVEFVVGAIFLGLVLAAAIFSLTLWLFATVEPIDQ